MSQTENRNNYPYERKKNRGWMIGGLAVVLLVAIVLFAMNRTDDMNELSPAAGQPSMMENSLSPTAPQNNDSTSPVTP